jgi:O-antigen/teichoic acid export membrane protein
MDDTGPHHSITRRLSRSVVFLVVDSVIVNVASFATLLVVARGYSSAVVGQLTVLLSIMAVGTLLGDLGNGQASTLLISRHLAGLGGGRPGRIAAAGLLQAVVGGLVMATVVFFFPELIRHLAERFGQADRAREIGDLGDMIRLVAVWVLLAVLLQQTAGVFAGFQKMQYSLVQDVTTHVPRLAICLVAALSALSWRWFIWGWTGWYVVAAVVGLSLLAAVLRRMGQSFSLAGYEPVMRLRTGAVLFTPLAAAFILYYLANAVIWWLDPHGAGYRSVGLFAPLWSLTRGYEVLLIPLATALLPAVSDAHGTRDPRVLESLVRRTLMVTGLAALGIFLLFVAAPHLLLGLFSPEYQALAFPLGILAFGMAFETQRCALDPILNGSGLARWVTAIDWAKFVLLLVLAVPLYRAHYLTGISLAFVGAFIPAWIGKLMLIRFRLKVRVLGHAAMVGLLLAAVFAANLFLHRIL